MLILTHGGGFLNSTLLLRAFNVGCIESQRMCPNINSCLFVFSAGLLTNVFSLFKKACFGRFQIPLGLFFLQDAPRRPQDAPRRPQNAPSWLQDMRGAFIK